MPAIELSQGSDSLNHSEKSEKEIEAYLTSLQNVSRGKFHDSVAELFFLQNGGNMMDFPLWKKKPPKVYQEFVQSFSLEADSPEEPVTVVPETAPSPVKTPLSSSLPVASRTSSQIGRPPQVAVMTPEQIVEKAKQEAFVMQRIAELQREGLWTEKRMPKVVEPSRPKSHWDYLLEEMAWLSADFVQERKWKKAAARKCARMVQKYFQDKAAAALKAEKEEEQRMKKIASFIAKEIRTFWSNVEKFLEYKQQTRLEEKRKKALDQHLNFIVTETEKYSTWLSEGLTQAGGVGSNPVSKSREDRRDSDGEFKPEEDSTDDEETIAKEEEDLPTYKTEKEIEDLKRESEMPLEDLLNELPPGYLDSIGQPVPETPPEQSDDEFEVDSDASVEDDEETIDQAEREAEGDSSSELMELEAEKDMPLEKLMERYGQKRPEAEEDVEHMDEDSEGLTGESESEPESETEKEEEKDQGAVKDIGIESLLENVDGEDAGGTSSKLTDAAALAESFQPKGNTLESTKVIAKVPFLLKHTLREYQHIGLDWMAAMYERKLNGILADEMGLGKTIQTIALLAWLACEKGTWGPHLVVVPTSVMLNWEMEFKKWCPAFKILTYYGSQKDRKQKRTGWTKPNAFHVCITSYKLVLQDHQAFRRKRWKYLILDEAQNIKNFKSQRWQLLLNFQTQRRLLLTGTPLQNNLMELWSLMHFLMPDIFESHRDFREWFSNPVTGMIEGNAEYNESVIRKLHKVLRPFILRRLKSEVEKQLPSKYEHVVMCRLSKRQRYLYDDFMSRAKTKETLETGNLLSVINVLMQLRKVCNHPNLFEQRPIVSPFQMEGIVYNTASMVFGVLDYDPFEHVDLSVLNLHLADLELTMTAFAAHRMRRFQAPQPLIQEIDSQPPPPPACPKGKIRLHVRPANPQHATQLGVARGIALRPGGAASKSGTPSAGGVAAPMQPRLAAPAPTLPSAVSAAASTGAAAVRQPGDAAAPPVSDAGLSTRPSQPTSAVSQLGGSATPNMNNVATRKPQLCLTTGSSLPGAKVVLSRLSTGSASQPVATNARSASNPALNNSHGTSATVTTRNSRSSTDSSVQNGPESQSSRRGNKFLYDRSVFKANSLEEKRRQERRQRLGFLAKLNKQHCEACPIYGADLVESVTLNSKDRRIEDVAAQKWAGPGASYVNCLNASQPLEGRRIWEALWSETDALRAMIRSPQTRMNELADIIRQFVVAIPSVSAPPIAFHVSHPPPSKLWEDRVLRHRLRAELSPRAAFLHPVASATMTQFPDTRLIQYDCGKLQTLDPLLRQLKMGKHRALIFTQMTRMLDVLEAFLNYHGYIYLRLDGTTRVDQRQALMERFNADPRIFCFILSTRSGGIGINLTGADTVIFYDSDWNPTMDAQAQDRCHRIGQTRDVHIYRLISERTVEENILKKANQKRLLGDIAIEGGNFSAASFKKSTIHDIFDVDAKESDASKRMAEVLERGTNDESAPVGRDEAASQENQSLGLTKATIGAFETALAAVEDETDVAAARTVRAEAAADMAEFDESAPVAAEGEEEPEMSKAEAELQQLEYQLTPVERYAMRFMEESESCWAAEQLRAAEAQIEEQKRAWEQRRLAALAEKESKDSQEDELVNETVDSPALTFSSQDANNQVPKRRGRGRPKKRPAEAETPAKESPTIGTPQEKPKVQSENFEKTDVKSQIVVEATVTSTASPENKRRRNGQSCSVSPRTRSRGTVNIDLWRLDVNPLLPGVKPVTPRNVDSPRKRRVLFGSETGAGAEGDLDIDSS